MGNVGAGPPRVPRAPALVHASSLGPEFPRRGVRSWRPPVWGKEPAATSHQKPGEAPVRTQGLKDLASDSLAFLGAGHSCGTPHSDPDRAPLLCLEAAGTERGWAG